MQTRIKLLIYLALWKRPHITEICFHGIERLKAHPDFDIQTLAVISEPEMIPLCERFGVMWTMADNEPLGAKKNHGLRVAEELDFDWMMEIGSDTLIMNELLDCYKQVTCDFFGVSDVVFIDTDLGACRRWISKATMFGAGRIIKRNVLERMNFKIWPDQIKRGLDSNSIYAIAKAGMKYRKTYPGEFPMVVELKSDVNIWKFNHIEGTEYPIENVLSRLSEKEQELIYAGIENKHWRA